MMTTQSIAAKQELVKVEFYGQEIEAIYNGQDVWVVVKRICENLGIDSHRQSQKIKTNLTFTDLNQLMSVQHRRQQII